MKKIISTMAVLAVCSSVAYAQEVASDAAVKPDNKVMTKQERKEHREMHMKDMSPQRRAHMEEGRKNFEALSPEKKKEMKEEIKRHRENMEKITGEKMPMPPCHEDHNKMEGKISDK